MLYEIVSVDASVQTMISVNPTMLLFNSFPSWHWLGNSLPKTSFYRSLRHVRNNEKKLFWSESLRKLLDNLAGNRKLTDLLLEVVTHPSYFWTQRDGISAELLCQMWRSNPQIWFLKLILATKLWRHHSATNMPINKFKIFFFSVLEICETDIPSIRLQGTLGSKMIPFWCPLQSSLKVPLWTSENVTYRLCWFFHCNCNWWWTIYHSTRLPIFLLSVYDPTKLKEGWNNAFRCDKILMLFFLFPCLPCNWRQDPFIWQTSWAEVSIARNSIVSETPNFKALHCCAVYLWPLRLWLLIIPN